MTFAFYAFAAFASAYLCHAQIDEEELIKIFGTPPTNTSSSATEQQPLVQNKDGEEDCQCVPYFLCDTDLNGVHITNASVTGYGELDIRFGGICQESVEKCCKNPKTENEVDQPVHNRQQGCGYRNSKGLDFTVTGGSGEEAELGEYPWVVALLDAKNGSYVGVGVLIHPNVVVTGAHVVEKYAPGGVLLRAGEWDTQTQKERLKHQERVAAEIKIHEGYRQKGIWNDMALLRVDQPFELEAHINVICLPDPNENFDYSTNCVANGWGKDVFGRPGRYAVILKKVELNMIERHRCLELFKRTRLGHFFKLHQSFVCAGGEEGKDTCTGDGGAPLACPIGEDRYKLTGLVAWGVGCGQKDVPAAYVNVPLFRSWIDNKMTTWGFDTSVYNV